MLATACFSLAKIRFPVLAGALRKGNCCIDLGLRCLAPPSPCTSESGAYPAVLKSVAQGLDNRPEARIGKAISRRSCNGLSLTGPCSGHCNLSPIGFRNSRYLLRFRLACVHVTRGVRAMRRSVSYIVRRAKAGETTPEIHSRVKNVMSLRDLFASLFAVILMRNAAFAQLFPPGVK